MLATLAVALLAAPPLEIAVTIDDLPQLGALAPGETPAQATSRLLQQLTARDVPVTGFVSCGRGELSALDAWAAAGVPLGNHTWSHHAVDNDPAWLADVARCDKAMTARWGRKAPRYFRYPFLRRGKTPALRDQTAAALREAGYTLAPVTIDTSDWVLARAYEAALAAGDRERQAAISAALVEHVAEATARFGALAQRRAGRPVKQILLLHGSALTADTLGAVLDRLRPEARFISLAEALTDPIYQAPDDYAGAVGMSWLLRVAPAEPALWAVDAGRARALAERFGVDGEGLPLDEAVPVAPNLRVRKLSEHALVVVHDVPWPANSVVYEAADGTLVLAGSPYFEESAEDLLAWLRTRYGSRPLLNVATHFHFDASGGVGAVQAAGGRTLASALTAELLATRQGVLRDVLVGQLQDRPALAAAMARTEVPQPAETFPDGQSLALDLGEPVQIIDPGPGHSQDNVVVWFPRERLLFGGCLVRAQPGTGFTGDANLAHWPQAIEGLKALGAARIVPGHGDRLDPGLLDFTQEQLARDAH